jgi:hypothetical protein
LAGLKKLGISKIIGGIEKTWRQQNIGGREKTWRRTCIQKLMIKWNLPLPETVSLTRKYPLVTIECPVSLSLYCILSSLPPVLISLSEA